MEAPPPDPTELARRLTPHSRGAILVAAVFDAFLAIYKARTADLYRIATGGTGELPPAPSIRTWSGAWQVRPASPPEHVLGMCIRALDYLPPLDVTFFEYLRALITADSDLVPDDRYNYRVALVEAFRRHGIYPLDLHAPAPDTPRILSADTLRWQGLDDSMVAPEARDVVLKEYSTVLDELRGFADRSIYIEDREELFHETRTRRKKLHAHLKKSFKAVPEFAVELGLDPKRSFEVHELRAAVRQGPDGRQAPQIILALTQSKQVKAKKGSSAPPITSEEDPPWWWT
jgi:hypothetical protein